MDSCDTYVTRFGGLRITDLNTDLPLPGDEETTCPICLEAIQTDENTLRHEKCRRFFHRACLEDHFELCELTNPFERCPWCRQSYDTVYLDGRSVVSGSTGEAPPQTNDVLGPDDFELIGDESQEGGRFSVGPGNYRRLVNHLGSREQRPAEYALADMLVACFLSSEQILSTTNDRPVVTQEFAEHGVTPDLVWAVSSMIRAYRSRSGPPLSLRSWTVGILDIFWTVLSGINGRRVAVPYRRLLEQVPEVSRRYGLPVEVAVLNLLLAAVHVRQEVIVTAGSQLRAVMIGFVLGNNAVAVSPPGEVTRQDPNGLQKGRT